MWIDVTSMDDGLELEINLQDEIRSAGYSLMQSAPDSPLASTCPRQKT